MKNFFDETPDAKVKKSCSPIQWSCPSFMREDVETNNWDIYLREGRKLIYVMKSIYVKSTSNPRNLRGLCGWTFIHEVFTWISHGFFPRGWNLRRIYLDISRM